MISQSHPAPVPLQVTVKRAQLQQELRKKAKPNPAGGAAGAEGAAGTEGAEGAAGAVGPAEAKAAAAPAAVKKGKGERIKKKR